MQAWKAVAAAIALAVTAAPPIASAEQAAPMMTPVTGTLLSVAAEGKATAKPDMAIVSLGVTTDGPTANAALGANATRMTSLMQALRRAGIAERDIQTSNISVNPQYQFGDNQAPRLTGYQASNQVTVKVRDVSKLGRVIDGAVGAGGNTVNGVSFTFQDTDAQMDAARSDAIQRAQRRAEFYARTLNMHVGRVISVSEGGGWSPPVPMPMMMARAEAAPAPPPPVAPGEIDTTASVTVVFELR